MSQTTSTAAIVPVTAVPKIVGTGFVQKALDHLKQPTSVAGVAGFIFGAVGLVTGGLTPADAYMIMSGGVAAILVPDNSTDRIKAQDAANAVLNLAGPTFAGKEPVSVIPPGSMEAIAPLVEGIQAAEAPTGTEAATAIHAAVSHVEDGAKAAALRAAASAAPSLAPILNSTAALLTASSTSPAK